MLKNTQNLMLGLINVDVYCPGGMLLNLHINPQLLNERYVRNLQLCGCALGLSNQFLNFSIAFFEFLFPIIVDYIELHRVLLMITQFY